MATMWSKLKYISNDQQFNICKSKLFEASRTNEITITFSIILKTVGFLVFSGYKIGPFARNGLTLSSFSRILQQFLQNTEKHCNKWEHWNEMGLFSISFSDVRDLVCSPLHTYGRVIKTNYLVIWYQANWKPLLSRSLRLVRNATLLFRTCVAK